MNPDKHSRRMFLGKIARTAAGTGVGIPILDNSFVMAAAGEMPYRRLGRSGEKVSLVGLGAYHIGIQPDQQESIRTHGPVRSGGAARQDRRRSG